MEMQIWRMADIYSMPEGYYWVKLIPEYPAVLMHVRKGRIDCGEVLFHQSESFCFGYYGRENAYIDRDLRALGPVAVPEF
jgi:hypothetical protein